MVFFCRRYPILSMSLSPGSNNGAAPKFIFFRGLNSDETPPLQDYWSTLMPGCEFYIRVLCGRFQVGASINWRSLRGRFENICILLEFNSGLWRNGFWISAPPALCTKYNLLWQILWILSFCVSRSEGKWGHVNLFNEPTNHLMFAFSASDERDLEME